MKNRQTFANEIIQQKLAAPNMELLKKIKNLHWTAHNIPLSISESTCGNDLCLVGDDWRTTCIKQNLITFLGKKDSLAGLRLLDLGCLEGGLSLEMAREDINVVGIEGRYSNFIKCQLIQEYFNLSNLKFNLSDVKDLNYDHYGEFDVVLCCGLLYHLDNPFQFLELLSTITKNNGVLFLDTHVAPPDGELLENRDFRNTLTDIVEFNHKGYNYLGRFFQESPCNEDGTEYAWASVSNSQSFWPKHESLLIGLYKSGFKKIYYVYSGSEEELKWRKKTQRFWMVAIKSGYYDQS